MIHIQNILRMHYFDICIYTQSFPYTFCRDLLDLIWHARQLGIILLTLNMFRKWRAAEIQFLLSEETYRGTSYVRMSKDKV